MVHTLFLTDLRNLTLRNIPPIRYFGRASAPYLPIDFTNALVSSNPHGGFMLHLFMLVERYFSALYSTCTGVCA